jgi:hypothetical protein
MSVMSVAPAGVRRTGRGPFCLSLPKHHSGRNPSIMTDQPSRVTPGEISALLDQARALARDAALADQIAYHERKASLLSRIAATPRHSRGAPGGRRRLASRRNAGPPARP